MGGFGSKLPAKETFLTDQAPPASGFLLGKVASTDKGAVTLRFPCGNQGDFYGTAITICEVKDINENVLFSVHRAGAEEKETGFFTSPYGWQPLRKASIVRDPKGVALGMLATDRKSAPGQMFGAIETDKFIPGPASYTGYAARPRFAGQEDSVIVEGVPMYAWFTFFAPGGGHMPQPLAPGSQGQRDNMIYLHGPEGLEPQHAFDWEIAEGTPHASCFGPLVAGYPFKFMVRRAQGAYTGPVPGTSTTPFQFLGALFGFVKPCASGTEEGVAYGDTINYGEDMAAFKPLAAPRPNIMHAEVTIAKGMDAGLVVMAAFCPWLLFIEYPRADPTSHHDSGSSHD